MPSIVILRLLLLLFLLVVNAFFVTAEFAIVSVRRSRINQLVEAGDRYAGAVQFLQRHMDRLLSTTQLGITLSCLGLGWIGKDITVPLIREGLAYLPLGDRPTGVESLALPLAFFLLVYLQIVLGELVPKSLALLFPEQLSQILAPLSLVIARIFNPFIWILNQSTRFLLGVLGFGGQTNAYHRVTPEELQLIITTERESSGLEAEERELLNNVFEFGEGVVEEVMVPRTQICAISHQATFQDVLQMIASRGHATYPVTGDSLDDVRGILSFQDLAQPFAQGLLQPDSPIHAWIKPVRFVGESMPLGDLLPLLQRSQYSIAIVVDEYGGTAGLITLQDVIAEIIGDDKPPGESADLGIQHLDEQTHLVKGYVHIEELNEQLDLDLPLSDEYQTLSGFIQYHWQKIPRQGEQFTYNQLRLTIVVTQGPRLEQVQIDRLETKAIKLFSDLDLPSLPPSVPELAEEVREWAQSLDGDLEGEESEDQSPA